MSALTAARDTKARECQPMARTAYPVKGSTTIYAGSLVVISAGYLIPGATATGKIAAGRACATIVNAGSDGAVNLEVDEGVFKWGNGESIAVADIGKACYVSTDAGDVFLTSSGKSIAGVIEGVDSDGVWVRTSLALSVALAS